MTSLRLVLGDQLTRNVASLRDITADDTVLMAEVAAEAGYANHHKKKLVFVFSAMRHFAESLKAEGINVIYTRLDDPENGGSIEAEISRVAAALQPDRIITTEPGEYRLLEIFEGLQQSSTSLSKSGLMTGS